MALCEDCGWDNEPRARFCANHECGVYLGWQGGSDRQSGTAGAGATAEPVQPPVERPVRSVEPPLVVGTRPQFQLTRPTQATVAVSRLDTTVDEPTSAGRTSAAGGQSLFVLVPQRDAGVAPGGDVSFPVHVHNTGDQIERAVVEARGVPDSWVVVDPPFVNLDLKQEGTVMVRVRPPRLPSTAAGPMAFSIVVWSADNPHVRCEESCRMTIGSFESVSFRPTTTDEWTRGRRVVEFAIDVENNGNATVVAALSATSGQGRASASCSPDRVAIAPGASMPAVVTMRPRQRNIVGAPAIHTCTVAADGPTGTFPVTLTLRQRGWLPQIVGRFLAPLMALALVVGFTVGRELWHDRARAVPDVVGTMQEEAGATLEDAGFQVVAHDVPSVAPAGEVLGQDPSAGERHRGDTTVTIQVSEGPPRIAVPEVRRMSYAEAKELLVAQRFIVVDGTERPDPAAPVSEQDPLPNQLVPEGSEITLFVETTLPP